MFTLSRDIIKTMKERGVTKQMGEQMMKKPTTAGLKRLQEAQPYLKAMPSNTQPPKGEWKIKEDIQYDISNNSSTNISENENILSGSTKAAIPNVTIKEYNKPNSNQRGFFNSDEPTVLNINKANSLNSRKETVFHEADHALANKMLGHAMIINRKYDELTEKRGGLDRYKLVSELVNSRDYLNQKYGLESGYFHPKMLEIQGPLAPNLLAEQLAVLSAIEQRQHIDITDDLELRKTVFNNPRTRENISALMGLRQTRLDARDLPPYTPYIKPENIKKSKKNKSFLEKIFSND